MVISPIDRIIVPEGALSSTIHPWSAGQALRDFIDLAIERYLYPIESIPREALLCHRAWMYVMDADDHGILEYLQDRADDPVHIDEAVAGLRMVGEAGEAHALQWAVASWRIHGTESLQLPSDYHRLVASCCNWVKASPLVRAVPDFDYRAAMDEMGGRNPAYLDSIQRKRDRERPSGMSAAHEAELRAAIRAALRGG